MDEYVILRLIFFSSKICGNVVISFNAILVCIPLQCRAVYIIQDREGEVWPEEDKTLLFIGFHFHRKLKASVISKCSEETVQ